MVALNAFPAASWIEPLFVRLNPTVAPFAATVPVVETVTVQLVAGGPDTGETELIEGAVPLNPLVTRAGSLAATALLTGAR